MLGSNPEIMTQMEISTPPFLVLQNVETMSESETISDSETISESETISDHESVIYEQDIDDNDDDEHIAFFTKNLSVSEVIHSAFPVEYPKTSPQGVATIFNVSGWTNPMVCFSDIQYSINGSGGSNSIQNCPFFGVPVKKDERKCQGIKHCSFASPEFINSQHCEVDVESETYIKLNQNYNKNNLKTKTYVFFLAAQSSVCKYKDRNQRCNGQAKLRKIIKNSGEVEYIIGCDKWVKGKKWHRYIKVPEEIDLRLLQDLFRGHDISENNDEDNVDNDCYTLIPRASKTKFCEFPHVQNGQVVRGTIVEQKCDVRFIKFIPYDLVACPYIALVCIGVHNHPPPPPDRTPVGIKDELQVMIQNSISLNDGTTPHSIITDNSIRATFDKETLSEVYASLNNVDKLRSLVAKGYKDLYPYGQDNLGVLYSVQCKKFDMHNYVRRIEHFEDGQILILCMLDFQAKALQQLKCFQMDLTYKRVYGNINEFEINAYDGVRKSVLSYCRIYTNIFTADAYQRLFTQLFEVVENLSGTPVKFRHIDNSGWECILGDLDPGQAKGLGMALEKRDPSKDWELHLTYIFKSCLIHFNRDLAAKRFDNEVYSLAASIPFQTSVEEVYGCFKQLESYNEPCITDWVQYHRQPYVLASLNKHVSNMENEVWECYGSNINATEAAHVQTNREGKQLKLLTAIMRGKRLDEKLFKKIEVHNKFGVSRARRDKSESKRKSIEMTRKDTHKRNQKETSITLKQEALPYDDITDHGGSGKRRNKRKTITNESTSNVKKNRVDINEIDNEQENDLFEVNNSLKNIEIEERRLH